MLTKSDGEELVSQQFEPVSGTFKVARFLVDDGEHRIEANKPIGVGVYGFDQYVSYGYPGGLDLKDLKYINETGE